MEKFKTADLVLAKYYTDPDANLFNWYRAIIIGHSSSDPTRYNVMYLDYGNCDKNVSGLDLVKLPDKYGLEKYSRPLAYKIRLADDFKFSIDQHGHLIEEFLLTVESFSIEIKVSAAATSSSLDINHNENNLFDFFTYDVLIWNDQGTKCLNHLIRSIQPGLKKTSSPKINKSSISTCLESKNVDEAVNLPCQLVFEDELEKPLFFCLESDMSKQEELISGLNSVYNSLEAKKKFSVERLADVRVDSFMAALSEGNWYRVRVKSIQNDQIHVFFVDFGYQDFIKESEFGQRLRRLDEKFTQGEYMLAFGAVLAGKDGQLEGIDTKQIDVEVLTSILLNFFASVEERKFNVKIVKKLGKLS